MQTLIKPMEYLSSSNIGKLNRTAASQLRENLEFCLAENLFNRDSVAATVCCFLP